MERNTNADQKWRLPSSCNRHTIGREQAELAPPRAAKSRKKEGSRPAELKTPLIFFRVRIYCSYAVYCTILFIRYYTTSCYSRSLLLLYTKTRYICSSSKEPRSPAAGRDGKKAVGVGEVFVIFYFREVFL